MSEPVSTAGGGIGSLIDSAGTLKSRMMIGVSIGIIGYLAYFLYRCKKKHGELNIATITECLAMGAFNTVKVLAKETWDAAKDFTRPVWKPIESGTKEAWDKTESGVKKGWNATTGEAEKDYNWTADQTKKGFKKFEKPFNEIPGLTHDLGNQAKNFGNEVAKMKGIKQIDSIGKTSINAIKNPHKTAQSINKAVKNSNKKISEGFSKFGSKIKSIF